MKRTQLSRRKGAHLPPNTRKVDRSTPWGNPFALGAPVKPDDEYCQEVVDDIDLSLRLFRQYATDRALRDPAWLEPLRGYDYLACWCPPDQPCHADILIELITSEDTWQNTQLK